MIIEPLVRSLKGLSEKGGSLDFPEERESLDDNERGMLRLDMSTCVSCSACEKICPNKTIKMVGVPSAKGGAKMPQVGLDRCMFCGLCEEVAPRSA